MESILQPNTIPTVTVLAAVMMYAALRAFQSAYMLVRDGILQWHGRRILGELKQEVDSGRRTAFELFIQHGIHYLQLRDPMRARSFFEAASQAHPMSPQGYYGQGLAWRESMYFAGEIQEQALLEALERDPNHADARMLLLEFYAHAGAVDKAREQYDLIANDVRCAALARTLEEMEESAGFIPARFDRATLKDKCLLTLFDAALLGLLGMGLAVPHLAIAAMILGVFVIPGHCILCWRMLADEDGLEVATIRRRRRVRWTDVTDLVEAPEGGFFLQTRCGALFFSRHWMDYAVLLRTIKSHLYRRGWVPLLRNYGRRRWVRPLIR